MTKKFLKTTNILRFAALFAVLALSACAGGAVPGASNSGNLGADALTGASIAALPQLGELFFTGTVQAMSATSVQVADMTFRVDGQTSWAQDLAVGSPVRVRALELPDATRYAVDVQRADSLAAAASSSSAEFKFYDVVVSMGADSWQIGSQTVLVDASTLIDAGIQTGSLVEVEGTLVNGQMLARKITLEASGSQTPMPNPTVTPVPAGQAQVEVTGKLDAIDSASLQVGGLTFAITLLTEINDNPVVGDIVKVEGFRAADGSLTAKEVKLADFDRLPPEGAVYAEIKGAVESINDALWVIGGFNVAVDASTEIYSGLAVGSFAKAEGTLQADGSLLAREIKPAEMDNGGEDGENGGDDGGDDHGTPMPGARVEFKGVVESIGAGLWVIGGRTVMVTAQTRIEGSPQVGDYVEVKAFAANNTLTASQIQLEDDGNDGNDDSGGSGDGDDNGDSDDDDGGSNGDNDSGDDDDGDNNGDDHDGDDDDGNDNGDDHGSDDDDD
mgnify:CR=1 FL=1